MDKLLIEKNNEELQIETKIITASELSPLINSDCLKIFKKLQEKSSFPAELSKELKINEQKVYYHIKQLKNKKLISVEKTEERNGALAKYYSASYDSFAIIPNIDAIEKKPKILKKTNLKKESFTFLKEFTKKGIFSAKIVVGSPDPHGKFKGRARDGHLVAELACFIGANCKGVELPLVFLDTAVKDLRNENSNLIILGGPVTNKLAEQINEFLPINFNSENGNWTIKSKITNKEYFEDSIGIIEKLPHPYFKGKWVLVIAGKRNAGTTASILAIAKKTKQTIKETENKTFARVVEGLDINGDGLIDEVEFKE